MIRTNPNPNQQPTADEASPGRTSPTATERFAHTGMRAVMLTVITVAAGALLMAIGMSRLGAVDPDDLDAVAGNVTNDGTDTAIGGAYGNAPEAVAVADLTDVSDVATRVVDSVVAIEVSTQLRGRAVASSSGSGIVLDNDGTIVTNAHVVDGASIISVVLTDGTRHDAFVTSIDPGLDVAVIEIDATNLTPIEMGSTEDLEVGDPVIAVGNPLGLEGGPSVSTGIVSALDRVLEDRSIRLSGIIQTDAAMTQGSSGGALLGADGRLIGITTAVGVSSVGVEGIGFAIPVETIADLSTGLP